MAKIPDRTPDPIRGKLPLEPKEENVTRYKAYTRMVKAEVDPAYVFDHLVETILMADPDFQKYLKENPDVLKGAKGSKPAATKDAASRPNGAGKPSLGQGAPA